jgi:hypothetical protein
LCVVHRRAFIRTIRPRIGGCPTSRRLLQGCCVGGMHYIEKVAGGSRRVALSDWAAGLHGGRNVVSQRVSVETVASTITCIDCASSAFVVLRSYVLHWIMR